MADELYVPGSTSHAVALKAIVADREQAGAWCADKAKGADGEADAQGVQFAQVPIGDHATIAVKLGRVNRCEGQAVAFRGVAAKLGVR